MLGDFGGHVDDARERARHARQLGAELSGGFTEQNGADDELQDDAVVFRRRGRVARGVALDDRARDLPPAAGDRPERGFVDSVAGPAPVQAKGVVEAVGVPLRSVAVPRSVRLDALPVPVGPEAPGQGRHDAGRHEGTQVAGGRGRGAVSAGGHAITMGFRSRRT
nr:hypothetical protein [Streptomyces sp. SS]